MRSRKAAEKFGGGEFCGKLPLISPIVRFATVHLIMSVAEKFEQEFFCDLHYEENRRRPACYAAIDRVAARYTLPKQEDGKRCKQDAAQRLNGGEDTRCRDHDRD